jgi:F-type H+-transporting ATPase subunit gamma
MATQRDIKRRITSVQNTRKITKAMEMVAAARLRRAQQRIEATRPYAIRMNEFIGGLARAVDPTSTPSSPCWNPGSRCAGRPWWP